MTENETDNTFALVVVEDDDGWFDVRAEFGGETCFPTKAEADAAMDEFATAVERCVVDRRLDVLRARGAELEGELDATRKERDELAKCYDEIGALLPATTLDATSLAMTRGELLVAAVRETLAAMEKGGTAYRERIAELEAQLAPTADDRAAAREWYERAIVRSDIRADPGSYAEGRASMRGEVEAAKRGEREAIYSAEQHAKARYKAEEEALALRAHVDKMGLLRAEVERLTAERDEAVEHRATLAKLVDELTPDMYEYTGDERAALAEASAVPPGPDGTGGSDTDLGEVGGQDGNEGLRSEQGTTPETAAAPAEPSLPEGWRLFDDGDAIGPLGQSVAVHLGGLEVHGERDQMVRPPIPVVLAVLHRAGALPDVAEFLAKAGRGVDDGR